MTYRQANQWFRRCLVDAVAAEMRRGRSVRVDNRRADVFTISAVFDRSGDSPIAVDRKTIGRDGERNNGKS